MMKLHYKNKLCIICGKEFTPNSGIHKYCVECRDKSGNPTNVTRLYQKTVNPKEYYINARLKMLKRIYGLTKENIDEMILKQNSKCAICGDVFDFYEHAAQRKSTLHIDHSHATGRVRAILCSHCNHLIAGARENVVNLNKAIEYLGRLNKA